MKKFITQLNPFILGLCHLASASHADARPPNILLFFADDWGRDAGCYADPKAPSPSDVVKTPNIDRLAHEGVVFNNAFYPCPQCTPSRGSLVTGCYFWRCGSSAILSGGDWRSSPNPFQDLPRFPHLLQSAGYVTAKAFKTLDFKPSSEDHTTYGRVISLDDWGRFVPDPFAAREEYLRYGLYVGGGTSIEDQERRRQQVVSQTRASLRRVLDACPSNQPFFLVFGPINTHRPYRPGSGAALWRINPDSLKTKLPPFLPDVSEVRTDYADYLGEVQALDLMVGIFREELEKAGRLRDTLIALTGDNGAPGFPHGKTQLYDFGSRAPLVICWPGHIKAGRAVNDFVNLMDLAPTFLEAAGVKPPKTMDAKSLLPELLSPENGWIVSARDTAIYGRSRHFIQARPGNLPYSSRAVRTRDFLYIRNFNPDRWPFGDPFGLASASPIGFNELADYGWLDRAPFRDMDPSLTKAWLVVHRNESVGHELYAHAFDLRPAEELYNLRVDPVQIHNVAASPQYAGQLHQLAEHLMSVLQETHDPVLNGAFDKPPYVEKKELQPRKME